MILFPACYRVSSERTFKKESVLHNPRIRTNLEVTASLVQLVERRSPKPNVGGSSPPGRESPLPHRNKLDINEPNQEINDTVSTMATTNPPKKKTNAKKPKPNTPKNDGGLLNELKAIQKEFTKITWPTVPQIWGNTIIVIVMVAIVSLGMWIADNTFRIVIQFLTEELPKYLT